MAEMTLQEYYSLSSLGYMYMRMGRNSDAEKTFLALLKLVDLQKHKIWLYKNLSLIYIRKKDYKEALLYINKAMEESEMKSSDAFLYILKAESYWQTSRFSEAEALIKQYFNFISE